MKLLIHSALISIALLISSYSFAAKPISEGQALGQCRELASIQFNNVKKTRLAYMRSTRGLFKAKIRVTSTNDSGLFLCTIENNQAPKISRLNTTEEVIASERHGVI